MPAPLAERSLHSELELACHVPLSSCRWRSERERRPLPASRSQDEPRERKAERHDQSRGERDNRKSTERYRNIYLLFDVCRMAGASPTCSGVTVSDYEAANVFESFNRSFAAFTFNIE